jgi:hypothetical protein
MADLQDAKKVLGIRTEQSLNKYLNTGWKLIAVAHGTDMESGEPSIKYSIGWFEDGKPVEPEI